MKTPPKDKPVRSDEDLSAEKDEFQTDEAVAAQDTEIKSEETDSANSSSETKAIDEVEDNSETGLNTEDQNEIF